MIQLSSKSILPSSLTHLDSVQFKIVNTTVFKDKALLASVLWKSKKSGGGFTVFKDIKDTLIEMCVGVEICVYCEHNEATDIEHIYPKKLYPEKAFTWDNYVLACGKCNTHHKSDKFKIFNPKFSSTIENVTPTRGTFIQPANDEAVFINPRVENPMDFLELDLINKQFIFTEIYPVGTKEYERAKYTKELLGLNTRAALVANRKVAAKFYVSRLEKYASAKASTNFQELMAAINDDWGGIDHTKDFIGEKLNILSSIKNDIISYSHPTVWKELIRQRSKLRRTDQLLNQVNEALTW